MTKDTFRKKIENSPYKEDLENFFEEAKAYHPFILDASEDFVEIAFPWNEYIGYEGVVLRYEPIGMSSIYVTKEIGRNSNKDLLIAKYETEDNAVQRLLAKGSITKDFCPICGKEVKFEDQTTLINFTGYSAEIYRCCKDCKRSY